MWSHFAFKSPFDFNFFSYLLLNLQNDWLLDGVNKLTLVNKCFCCFDLPVWSGFQGTNLKDFKFVWSVSHLDLGLVLLICWLTSVSYLKSLMTQESVKL